MNPIQSASDLAKQLYASIQKQTAPVGKAISQVAGNAGNVVQNAIHNAAVQVTNAGNTANYNAWHSPVGQGLVAAQNFIQSPKPISLPQVPAIINRATQIPTPFGNFQPVQVARDVVNTPISFAADALSDVSQNIGRTISGQPLAQYQNLKSPASRLGYNIGSVLNPQSGVDNKVQNTPQQIIGNTAGTIQGPLSVYGGGKVLGIGKTAIEDAAGQTLLNTIKKSVISGGAINGIYGLLDGLANGRNGTLPKQLIQGATEGVQGVASGAVLGGTLGAGGYTFGALKNKLSDVLIQNHDIPKEQATKIVSQFARDELGKFSGVKQTPTQLKQGVNQFVSSSVGKSANEPLYYSDLRKAIGLPESGDYQSGFINFGAGVGNKAEQVKPPVSSTQQYLDELAGQQKAAKDTGVTGVLQKGKDFLANVKSALVDSASPIEDAVSLAEKKNNFQVRPTNDIRLQIDRVLRSKSLASQFAEDNGLTDAIKQAPDLHALDQYMIAKHAASVGTTTGRDASRDAQLVKDLAPQYEGLSKQVTQYSQKLLDYSVQSGLIPQELAIKLKQKYPDYVPINRIFNELETNGYKGAGSSIASLSKQTVVQGLKGSERAIQSPIESLLLKTQDAFMQGEKNQAAKMLASYKDLPGMKDLITPVKSSPSRVFTTSPHTFSYLDNGVKKVFQTTPEIATAAKNLDAQQMNVVTKILSYPTRALQLGATGLNTPFAATNLLKDQIDGFINSNRAMKTSLANPQNFLQAMFSAVKHDEGYKEVVRNAGMGTSFDISREAPNLAVNQIRAGRSIGSQIKYTASNPAELLRAVENTIGRTEELTRIQQYKGQYQALIKEGRTPQDARLLAAQAARNNTANFARSGNLGKVLNYVIPFFNAGIQGPRSFIRAAKANPIQTGAKLTTSLFLPMAAATLWNNSDPARQKIYNDIQESDKEKNIIIIPDGATQDASGKWNVIKIPLPAGLANLTNIVRRGVEQSQGGNPLQAKEVFDGLIGATTPLDTSSPAKLVGGLTPQAIKPFVEGVTNTNLYTGNKIVPDSMKNLPPQEQVKPNTSPLAKLAGNAIGQSPLLVEDAARTALGGVGGQLLGQNPLEQLQGRFTQASGGQQANNQFNDIQRYQQEQATTTNDQKQGITKTVNTLFDKNTSIQDKQTLLQTIAKDPKLLTQVKNAIRDKATGVTASDRAIRNLSTVEQAKYIKSQITNPSMSVEDKKALVVSYQKKGILTKTVIAELKKQIAH